MFIINLVHRSIVVNSWSRFFILILQQLFTKGMGGLLVLLFVIGASAVTQFASNILTSAGGSTYFIVIQNASVIQVQTVITLNLGIKIERYSPWFTVVILTKPFNL